MTIIRLLTRKHLLANKGRTIVTIMGITISVAMITAVFVAMASFFSFFGKTALISDGDAEAVFQEMTYENAKSLEKDKRIEKVGYIINDPLESGFILEGEGSKRIRIGNLFTGDSTNLQQMISGSYEGTLPLNRNQAAVEEAFLVRNSIKPEKAIGQTIKVKLGHRTWDNGQGEIKTYYGGYQEDEMWEEKGECRLVITAILHHNPATAQYKIVRGISEDELLASKDFGQKVDAMISLKHVDQNTTKLLDQMAREYGVNKYVKNDEYLNSKLSIRPGSTFATMLPLLGVVMTIIVFASIILIYNAFAMSLTDRVRYLGMLSSLGATKAQKAFSVYYEGFLLGLMGIPLGFLTGVAGIGCTLAVVERMMRAADLIPALQYNESLVSLKLVVPLWSIPFIIGFSFLTIFMAAFIPAHRASKIMPMDAIRQTQEIKVKKGKLSCPKYVKYFFGFEGELAYKNLKRNAGKSRIITGSIVTSIILFLSVSHFCGLFWSANDQVFTLPFQVTASCSYQEGEKLRQEIQRLPDVDDLQIINMIIYEYDQEKKENPNLPFMDPENMEAKYHKMFSQKMTVFLKLLDDKDFATLCENNDLKKEDYYGPEIKGLVCNNVAYKQNGKKVFKDSILGQKMDYDDKEKNNAAEIILADFVKWEENDHLYGMYSPNTVTVFAPLRNYVDVLYGGQIPEEFTMDLGIYSSNQENTYIMVQDLLDEGHYAKGFCQNISDNAGAMTALFYILGIFGYGFITLIIMITIANIVNSISTGIHQRRKEFAMLKSVGMTQQGFMKMIRLETFFYGIRSLGIGLPCSLLSAYLMNGILDHKIPYDPNLINYIWTIIVVFVLLALTMTVSISSLKNDSIIDTLKTDIL